MTQYSERRIFVAAMWLAIAMPAMAQEKPAGDKPEKPAIKVHNKSPEKKPAGKKPVDKNSTKVAGVGGMNKSREAAALAFVHENHPELESLLANLKERQPKQYEAAIRDLFRQSERLANAQEKDAARYELELQAWKSQSRVQLLTATVLMSPDDTAAQGKLKSALIEQLEIRRQFLELERDRAARRLQKLDEQIQRFGADIESTAERQLQDIVQPKQPKASAATTASGEKGSFQPIK